MPFRVGVYVCWGGGGGGWRRDYFVFLFYGVFLFVCLFSFCGAESGVEVLLAGFSLLFCLFWCFVCLSFFRSGIDCWFVGGEGVCEAEGKNKADCFGVERGQRRGGNQGEGSQYVTCFLLFGHRFSFSSFFLFL